MWIWLARIFALGRGILGRLASSRLGTLAMFFAYSNMGRLTSVIFKVLGITVVTKTVVAPAIRAIVITALNGTPPVWAQMIAYSRIDEGVLIILSAVIWKATMKSTEPVWHKPGATSAEIGA